MRHTYSSIQALVAASHRTGSYIVYGAIWHLTLTSWLEIEATALPLGAVFAPFKL